MTKPMSRAEGERRTAEAVKEYNQARSSTGRAMITIQKCWEDGAHLAMGKRVDEWLEENFPFSSSYIFARLQQRKALQAVGAPENIIQKIPESNARQLTRLPEKLRKSVLKKAAEMEPKQFKCVVNEIREKKLGLGPEQWKTYAFPLPLAVYEATLASDEKLARVLQLDVSEELRAVDFKKWTANRVTVAEAKAQLINGTDESRLKVEIEGNDQEDARFAASGS